MSEERNITARFTADTSGFSPAVNEIIQKLKSLNGEYEQNQQKIKQLNAEMKGYQSKLRELENAERQGTALTAEQRREMQTLRDNIARCATELGTYRAAQSTLRSDITQTTRELNEQRDAVNNVSNAAATFGDVLKANIISDVVHMGLQKTLELLKSAAAYCYQVGTSFEAAMSQVEAISGASASQLEQLTAKAKELGSTTKFTATEAAGAMNYMAMAGWDAEQMLSGIDGVLSLAAASGEDLGVTADIVSDAITAFGLEADRCSHFANILAAASANANTNVALMGETFKYCAADAGSLGFSAEDTVTAIGLMASAGIKGSQAGTALRKLFTEMSGDLTLTSEKIGDITIKTADASGEMRPFIDIVKELRTEFAKLNPQEQTAAAKELVGQYAQTGFKTLMNASEEAFEKLTYAIENCDGAAASMAKTMQENLAGQVTIFQSALEGLGISVYDKFGGALRDTVAIFTDCISDMTDSVEDGELDESISRLADSFKSAATELAGFASDNLPGFIDGIANALDFVITFRNEIAGVVTTFVTFKATMSGAKFITDFLRSVKSLATSFGILKTATNAATVAQEANNIAVSANPYMAVISVISLLVGAFVTLSGHIDTATDKIEKLHQSSKEYISAAEESKKAADNIRDLAKEYADLKIAAEQTDEVKERLKEIQDLLLTSYGTEANQLDLVNGKYQEQIKLLDELAEKKNGDAKSDAIVAYNDLMTAEELESTIKTEYGNMSGKSTVAFADDKFWALIKDSEYLQVMENDYDPDNPYSLPVRSVIVSGDTENKMRAYEAIKNAYEQTGYATEHRNNYKAFVELYDKYAAQYTENQAKIDAYNYYTSEDNTPQYYNNATANEEERKGKQAAANYEKWKAEIEAEREAVEKSAEELAAQYKEKKQLADDMYGVEEISAEEYYKRLTVLRDSYLEQGSHEWYVATKEIKSLAEKLGDGIADTAKTTADKIKDALSDVKSEYQKTLDAIDAEIERHNRERQDKEYQGKVDALNARLKYEQLDIFSRRELEQELADIYEEWDETKYQRDTVDAKSLLETVYTQTQDMINTAPVIGIDQLNTVITSALESVGENYAKSIEQGTQSTQAVYNIVVNAQDKTTDQIVREVQRAISSGVI